MSDSDDANSGNRPACTPAHLAHLYKVGKLYVNEEEERRFIRDYPRLFNPAKRRNPSARVRSLELEHSKCGDCGQKFARDEEKEKCPRCRLFFCPRCAKKFQEWCPSDEAWDTLRRGGRRSRYWAWIPQEDDLLDAKCREELNKLLDRRLKEVLDAEVSCDDGEGDDSE